jgi:general secretion pathway protein L
MKQSVMIAVADTNEAFSRWIDSVAQMAASLLGRIGSPSTIRLVEAENGEFRLQLIKGATVGKVASPLRIRDGQIDRDHASISSEALAGNHVELVLQPDRFLFRPLELPNRASEFLAGIVRSQIDRLTPWTASDAAYGWSKLVKDDTEKITVTVAATTISLIKPYVQAIANIGAASIAVFVLPPESQSNESLIKVWEQRDLSTKDIARTRQMLVRVLAGCGIAAAISVGASTVASVTLSAQQDQLLKQISGARSAASASTAAGAQQLLERRKYDSASAVLVLETLSKILPDQTYVTELQVEGNKLRVSGITQDAPALITLIEQSGRFTRASFFAPTTRSTSNAGDRYHIEAIIKPIGSSS